MSDAWIEARMSGHQRASSAAGRSSGGVAIAGEEPRRLGHDASPTLGFVVTGGRVEKAAKIGRIIQEALGRGFAGERLLDIGIGTGEIVSILSREVDAFGVDVVDQRTHKEGYLFARGGEMLPFPDRSFDLVISNHVIEHVRNQVLHLAEIARVLRPGGCAYLATPNRLWPWEVHYGVPLLHYLPKRLFEGALIALGRFREEVQLLTWWQLRDALNPKFQIQVFSDRIICDPRGYFLSCPSWAARILGWIPTPLSRRLVFLHPTFVVVLVRR